MPLTAFFIAAYTVTIQGGAGMRETEVRRSTPVLSIGTACTITGLTARQIRYYESQGLLKPHRTAGGQRQFSMNDVDVLLAIKDDLAAGYTLGQVKERRASERNNNLSDEKARVLLRDEMLRTAGFLNDTEFPRN